MQCNKEKYEEGRCTKPPAKSSIQANLPNASKNTGPKGVLQDWNTHQQSERQKRVHRGGSGSSSSNAVTLPPEREGLLGTEEKALINNETLNAGNRSRTGQDQL